MPKWLELSIEWGSTVLVIVGALLTSFNTYPLNIYVILVGNFGWMIIGLMWKKPSLIIIQTVLTLIYIAGLINANI